MGFRVLTGFLIVLLFLAGFVATVSATEPRTSRERSALIRAFVEIDDDRGADENSDDESDDESSDDGTGVPGLFEFFETDPRNRSDVVIAGDALERLDWQADEPAFPGDPSGSLTALYDARLAPGLFGLPSPVELGQYDAFTAAAVFVIEPDGFIADPNGFFQISWGLWNSQTTGLDRTGGVPGAANSFELIEFDYFPNVSSFGGPYLAPTVFGRDDAASGFFSSFDNGSFLFGLEVALPMGVPLLAVLTHQPGADSASFQVYRVVDAQTMVPITAAVGVVSLDSLALREYTVDTIGLTLWQDGFTGGEPSVVATLRYHALVVLPRVEFDPARLLDVPAP